MALASWEGRWGELNVDFSETLTSTSDAIETKTQGRGKERKGQAKEETKKPEPASKCESKCGMQCTRMNLLHTQPWGGDLGV